MFHLLILITQSIYRSSSWNNTLVLTQFLPTTQPRNGLGLSHLEFVGVLTISKFAMILHGRRRRVMSRIVNKSWCHYEDKAKILAARLCLCWVWNWNYQHEWELFLPPAWPCNIIVGRPALPCDNEPPPHCSIFSQIVTRVVAGEFGQKYVGMFTVEDRALSTLSTV